MRVRELTSSDIGMIFEGNPHWVAENTPVWCFDYYPETMVELNPEWMVKYRKKYMADYYPEIMVKYNLSWMLKHRLEYMKDNHPDRVRHLSKETIMERANRKVPKEILELIMIPIY